LKALFFDKLFDSQTITSGKNQQTLDTYRRDRIQNF
jgi:hypothetical protein